MAVPAFRLLLALGRKALPFCIAALAVVIPTQFFAQDIHLEPRAAESTPPVPAEQLKLHMAPLKVNVNLVLVPVTVTDELNRPVIGLSKDDFSLLEGDARQDI